MKIKTITKKFLNDVRACPDGYKWFCRNYPEDLKITKTNIKEMFKSLNRRKKPFEDWKLGIWDTCNQMHWLLCRIAEQTVGANYYECHALFLDLNWNKVEIIEAVDVWYKCYKKIP